MVLNTVTIQDDPMEVGNADATTDIDKNMQEELLSEETTNNGPNMQVTEDQILQINVLQDKIDSLCPGTKEDPTESPASDNLRDRINPSQPEPAKSEPGPDNIKMVAEPPKKPDTTPEGENRTTRFQGQWSRAHPRRINQQTQP